jgi:ice-binding like protein/Big-like domain-containing protein
VNLRTADSYAVLSGSGVTNTGGTVITGDLGVSPLAAVTGFPPGIVHGAIHRADAPALKAKNDRTTAYNDAAGRTPFSTLTGSIAGATLTPGVYRASSTLLLTGGVTINALGNPNAVFIIQVGSALTTATDSSVNLVNGAQACNVYWQIGTDTTIGVRTAFKGTVLGANAITVGNGAQIQGRLLAGTANVTLINDRITRSGCAAGTTPGSGGGTGGGGNSGTGGDNTAPRTRIVGLPGLRQPGVFRPGVRRPRASKVCTRRSFTASVRIRDGSGIRRVHVYLDGKRVKRTTRTRFSLRVNIRGLRVGAHRITVIARDKAGNRSVTSRRFGRCALAVPAPRFTG